MSVNKVKDILLEEYEKRIAICLLESIQLKTKKGIDVWKNADQCKVRHDETGLEFTFGGFIEKNKVMLYLPEESRMDIDVKSLNKIFEEAEFNDEGNFFTDKEERYVDYNKNSGKEKSNRNYVIISVDTFAKQFSL